MSCSGSNCSSTSYSGAISGASGLSTKCVGITTKPYEHLRIYIYEVIVVICGCQLKSHSIDHRDPSSQLGTPDKLIYLARRQDDTSFEHLKPFKIIYISHLVYMYIYPQVTSDVADSLSGLPPCSAACPPCWAGASSPHPRKRPALARRRCRGRGLRSRSRARRAPCDTATSFRPPQLLKEGHEGHRNYIV